MTEALLIELAWKSAVIAGLTLVVDRLLFWRSAAERSVAAHLGLVALLVLPLAVAMAPALEVAAPRTIMPELALANHVSAPSPISEEANTKDLSNAPTPVDLSLAIEVVYNVMAAAMLALLVLAIARLRSLKRRAHILTDARWHTALVAAQTRLDFKHGAVLLGSSEVDAPVSWGFVRPTIVMNIEAENDPRNAEITIAHELAHVASYDWLKLLAARVVVALFWFNPLVWMLARRCHDLCEAAADDLVLKTQVPRTEYAQALVDMARSYSGRLTLAAHGVAPTLSKVGERVNAVLDTGRRRAPAGASWTFCCVALTCCLSAPLAGLEFLSPTGREIDPLAGERAAAQLAALGQPHTLALAQAIGRHDWNLRKPVGATTFNLPRAEPPLVSALSDDVPVVRRIAIWGLSEMRPLPADVGPSVAPLLADADPEVRGQAARALGEMGAQDYSGAVGDLLSDRDSRVALNAAHALGDLQDPRSRVDLENAVRHPDPRVRAKAIWALQQVTEAENILARYRSR